MGPRPYLAQFLVWDTKLPLQKGAKIESSIAEKKEKEKERKWNIIQEGHFNTVKKWSKIHRTHL